MITVKTSWRLILVITNAIHLFIFFGVFLEGILLLISPLILIDSIYGAFFLFLGGVGSMIAAGQTKQLLDKKKSAKILKRWQRNQAKVIMTSIAFLLIYLFRFQLSGLLAFAGFEIGSFFIQTAQHAYQFLFGIDLRSIGMFKAAWIFQWHYFFAIIGIAEAVGRKVGGWFGV